MKWLNPSDSPREWRRGRSDVVHSDPDILSGTPVFVGTRVPVQSISDGGWTKRLGELDSMELSEMQRLKQLEDENRHAGSAVTVDARTN